MSNQSQRYQEHAAQREYDKRLEHVHELESILGLPLSTRPYTWGELLARETNLAAQAAANLEQADPEIEAGHGQPLNLSDFGY